MSYLQSQQMYLKMSAYYQNSIMMNSIVANKLLEEKRNKSCTPLSIVTPKKWENINGILLERCLELKRYCDKFLEDKYELYLFGSQISGFSQSGSPDLDIWCLYKGGTFEQRKNIVQACNFKLDFAFIENLNSYCKYIELFPTI